MKRVLSWLWVALTLFARPAPAQEETSAEPEANPGRPTVSTPATLTPVGYLQFETGVLDASHSPEFSSRFGFNEVLKFSPTSRLELLASGEPVAHYTTGGQTANSVADVFVGPKPW
jgi:hypothetical protein